MTIEYYKLPRLYLDLPLEQNAVAPLSPEQAHYLRNVLRREAGDSVRVFNPRDGEWLCRIDSLDKKSCLVAAVRHLRSMTENARRVHLYFAPIRKSSLDWLIEKAVELGATNLHPVITQNTERRDLNMSRLQAQIAEAAEQCERLDIPLLHDIVDLPAIDDCVPMLVCAERGDARNLSAVLAERDDMDISLLIGPVGGFTDHEFSLIAQRPAWIPVTLGDRVLRCETAVCAALSAVMLRQDNG